MDLKNYRRKIYEWKKNARSQKELDENMAEIDQDLDFMFMPQYF